METKKYGLYSQLVGKSCNKKIKESNDFDSLWSKGINLLKKDSERLRDYFIIEYGVKAVKVDNQVIL